MPTKPGRPRGAGAEDGAPSRKRRGGSAAGWPGPEEDAFERWLRDSLREAYGAVAAEPVPDDILRLIEEDRAERERFRRRRGAKEDE